MPPFPPWAVRPTTSAQGAPPPEHAIPESEREEQGLSSVLAGGASLTRRMLPADARRATAGLRAKSADPSGLVGADIRRFLAPVYVDGDGVPTILARGSAPERVDELPIRPFCWATPSGACLRVLVAGTGRLPRQAVLTPGGAEMQAFEAGFFRIAYARMGRIDGVLEVDLRGAGERLAALRGLLGIAKAAARELDRDPASTPHGDLLVASTVTERLYGPEFGPRDWLQVGWARAAQDWWQRSASLLVRITPQLRAAAGRWGPDVAGVQGELAQVLAGEASAAERIHAVHSALREPETFRRYFDRSPPNDILPGDGDAEMRFALMDLLNGLAMDAGLSDWGLRLPYCDGWEVALKSLALRPTEMRTQDDPDALRRWWGRMEKATLPFDAHCTLTGDEVPIDPDSPRRAWSGIAVPPGDANATAAKLLEEAVALRRWTIPPGARVELDFGPFTGARLHEVGNEVYFVWTDDIGRFHISSVGTERGSFAGTNIFLETEDATERVRTAMELLMASLVRDFWILEDRRKAFAVALRRGPRRSGQPDRPAVVYLPRVRYVPTPRTDAAAEALDHATRSRHYVAGHLRRANPSPAQALLARALQVALPEGHTWVRGHFRGMGAERERVYRSRSALALLYEAVEPLVPTGEAPSGREDWFQFEADVAKLLERWGVGQVTLTPRGKTDDGIDVLGSRVVGDTVEVWLAQCRRHAPSVPVSVAEVREFLGAVADRRNLHGAATIRALFVTTSRFTPDAQNLAARNGLLTLDGAQWTGVLASENTREPLAAQRG